MMNSTGESEDSTCLSPWDSGQDGMTQDQTMSNDETLSDTISGFQPMGCSTLKPNQGDRMRSRSEDLDHNFDLLPERDACGPDLVVYNHKNVRSSSTSDDRTAGKQSTNSYLKKYQEKYGEMGLFPEKPEEDISTVCFPYYKDLPKTPTTQSLATSVAHDLMAVSRSAPAPVRSSWDPQFHVSRRQTLDKGFILGNAKSGQNRFTSGAEGYGGGYGRSSGHDWHCQVYNNNLYPGRSEEDLDKLKQEYNDDSVTPNVTLSQTALHTLNSAYSRGRAKPLVQQENRVLSISQKPLSLSDLTGIDSSSRGDVLSERKGESPIPVIDITNEYDTNDFTPKRPGRSRTSRRAVSDLGFRSKEAAIVPTPRTAALLSNPAFRKHLAKNIGVSEGEMDESDFHYDYKLSLPSASPEVVSPKKELDGSPNSRPSSFDLRERILRTSISESSLNQPSASLRSDGASTSNGNHLCLPERSISSSTDSLFHHIDDQDMFITSPNALNRSFCALESASAPNSPATRDTSPYNGKSKFHIPSFREFRENRSKRSFRNSFGTPESHSFELIAETPIEEEDEGEEEEAEAPEIESLQSDSPLTLARALNFDLSVSQSQRQGQDQQQLTRSDPEVKSGDCVMIYNPIDEVPSNDEGISAKDTIGPFQRATANKNDVRKSKRSHKPRSHSSNGNYSSVNNDGLNRNEIQDANVQDSRGKHRKEPSRRSQSESRLGHTNERDRGHSHQTGCYDDNLFDSSSHVKVIKEFKIRDSMKIHASDSKSKIMLVMIKDDHKRDSSPKSKDVNNERPPIPPDSRRKKIDSKGDETYVIEEQMHVMKNYGNTPDEPIKRDVSKSRSGGKRSSARFKKDRRLKSQEEKERPVFDDKVVSGHPGDGFAMKPRTELRRSTRRSNRRRILPKTPTTDEPIDKVNELTPDQMVTVSRSVSDISDRKAEEERKRGIKERRQKIYKSDPFHGSCGKGDASTDYNIIYRTVKPRSSREEILNLLHEAKSAVAGSSSSTSSQSLESCGEEVGHGHHLPASPPSSPCLIPPVSNNGTHSQLSNQGKKNGPSGVEVERVDSGVGAELKDSMGAKEFKAGPICEDCEELLKTDSDKSTECCSDNMADTEFLCRKCEARRVERKETIQELADTEVTYGKDLSIIKEEFYQPMKAAGLLSPEQLETVFSNLDELITINDRFSDSLLDSLELANEQGDEDYTTVHIGRLFMEASNMLLAFETYCVNQASVPTLLEKLEEEKELLRIFLQVSQTENSLLRRMNLRSFLMVPVQRVMKYPLLLNRLHKVTPIHHEDREALKKAQIRVEDILEHINSQSRGGNNATMRIRRKISGLSVIKKTGSADDIEINKMAIELLGWNRKDVNFILSGKIHFTQPTDHLWMKGRALKFIPAYALLLTLGRSTGERWTNKLLFSRPSGIQDAALVLIKEKVGKFVPLREPLRLERCVVSEDPEFDEVFEIMDANKETFLLKAEDRKDTQTWLRNLKLQTKDLGIWRRRRNALPNIMIQTTKT